MEINEFLNLIKRKIGTIIFIVLLFLVFTVFFTVIQPFKYGSKSRLLVVQNFPASADLYAISKSNEHLSGILAKVIYSNSFYNDVLASGFNIDRSYFSKNSSNLEKEMKRWGKAIEAKVLSDTGIIDIKIFHTDKSQLEQISQAINFILKAKHQFYHGSGDNVSVKVIDQPIISNWPVKPNVVMNLVLAFIFGLIASLSYIYFFPEEKYNIRLWPKRSRTKKSKKEVRQEEKYLMSSEAGKEPVNNRESNNSDNGHKETSQVKDFLDGSLGYEDIEKKGDIDNIFGQQK
ncbi:hypothetical protein COV49_00570 [Candidatus Falkowbacteria bacterium CG11_big_fil_rev_8_21_14_0_20_39_10]|uniref:Polysaccharide chain length determinant N-terminal domain-containing protein n=1 Tax=Candidatus Falkowbacteria bacterium CG11_big_fil_rev_8_21_14_0_20_39_10 TaxID=1974570 RepID=A0A2M6KA25_9BACT|nr:MAG: hypothetical protein COV49_00570 [Candidatus Falkowbacteria bacterium CG11_big_fil_rev_8_21_14_0_20_39_10]